MRLTTLTAAPFLLFSLTGALSATNIVQAGATSPAAITTSASTTVTLTRTVLRVVQTTTATRDPNAFPTASLGLPVYANATAGVLGTAGSSSGLPAQTTYPVTPMMGVATRRGLEGAALIAAIAAAGLLGWLVN